jgi:hypothetical protein
MLLLIYTDRETQLAAHQAFDDAYILDDISGGYELVIVLIH